VSGRFQKVLRTRRANDVSDTGTCKMKLVSPIAIEDNMRFAIREGGKTVGAGVVTKIVA